MPHSLYVCRPHHASFARSFFKMVTGAEPSVHVLEEPFHLRIARRGTFISFDGGGVFQAGDVAEWIEAARDGGHVAMTMTIDEASVDAAMAIPRVPDLLNQNMMRVGCLVGRGAVALTVPGTSFPSYPARVTIDGAEPTARNHLKKQPA